MALLPVLTPAQAAEWDTATAARGVPPFALMESAGRGAVAVLTARFPSALRQGALVLAGAGNNGGDGWAIARGLHALGLPVWVAALPGTPSDLNRLERTLATEAGVREVALDGPWPAPGLLIDAILGTGARGAPREPARTLLARVADLALPIVAVDGPSGLDLDDGVSHGALPAVLTITFGGFRRGHLLARDEVGDVLVLDIGFVPPPPEWPRLFSAADAAIRVLPFASNSHKGTRGRVAVVGGDVGMSGAARMAARAAFAAGAGLVHALAPAPTLAVLAQAEPDLQTAECPFDRPPTGRAAEVLAGADAVVIGPGLGRAPGRAEFVEAVAGLTRGAIVLDADGLIAFGGHPARIGGLVRERGLVLTPHAGEFRALFPDKASRLATDPWTAASEAAGRGAGGDPVGQRRAHGDRGVRLGAAHHRGRESRARDRRQRRYPVRADRRLAGAGAGPGRGGRRGRRGPGRGGGPGRAADHGPRAPAHGRDRRAAGSLAGLGASAPGPRRAGGPDPLRPSGPPPGLGCSKRRWGRARSSTGSERSPGR